MGSEGQVQATAAAAGRGGASAVSGAGRRAVIVVDVQNDFIDGSLATARGEEVARAIAPHVAQAKARGEMVVGTKDWHVNPVGHFAPAGMEPDFVTTWPVHCVAGTAGAEVHEALADAPVDAWFHKGEFDAAYSGFEGQLAGQGATGAQGPGMGLAEWLTSHDVTEVQVVGIATDYCVRATALDAVKAGFDTVVIPSLCAEVDPAGVERVLAELEKAGVRLGEA